MTSSGNHNRMAVVTGATSGVGEEAAAQLAAAGFSTVVVTGRTQAKADTAARTLAQRAGYRGGVGLALDLDDAASVTAATTALVERGEQVDVLLLNAGLVAHDPSADKHRPAGRPRH